MAQLPILMKRERGYLTPVAAIDAEELDRITLGATVEVTVRQRRSNPHHRFFFACLGKLVASAAVPFSTVDELLDALKLSCGVTQLRKGIGGAPYIMPGSISFAAKDEPAFKEFREKAFALIASHYGVDPVALLEETRRAA